MIANWCRTNSSFLINIFINPRKIRRFPANSRKLWAKTSLLVVRPSRTVRRTQEEVRFGRQVIWLWRILGPEKLGYLTKYDTWILNFELKSSTNRNPISVFIIKVTVKRLHVWAFFINGKKEIGMELKIKNEKNLFILSKQTELWRNGYECIEKRSKRMKEKQRPKVLNLAKRPRLDFNRENNIIKVSGHFEAQSSATFGCFTSNRPLLVVFHRK